MKIILYFCGLCFDENNSQIFQKTPKLMKSKTKFSSLHSIPNYQKRGMIASGISRKGESIYHLNSNTFREYNLWTLMEFYSNKHEMTYKTIELRSDQTFDGNDLTDLHNYKIEDQMITRFEVMFKTIKFLGEGGYGKVYEVKIEKTRKNFAIKVIPFKGQIKSNTFSS